MDDLFNGEPDDLRNTWVHELNRLRDENKRLRKALEFYAYGGGNYYYYSNGMNTSKTINDHGHIARRALEETE